MTTSLSVSRNASSGRDEFEGSMDIAASGRRGFAITPDDDTDLAVATTGIWVGGAGTLTVILADDTVATDFPGIAVGTWMPIAAKRVLATGTTATNLRGVA